MLFSVATALVFVLGAVIPIFGIMYVLRQP
jgi:hypothetical protein